MKWNVRNRLTPTTKVEAEAELATLPPGFEGHSIVVESTTGVVACGASYCQGECGLPALTLEWLSEGRTFESRVFGSQVACGPVLQACRGVWKGAKVPVTLGDSTADEVFKLLWW